jgi:hypothetical protein
MLRTFRSALLWENPYHNLRTVFLVVVSRGPYRHRLTPESISWGRNYRRILRRHLRRSHLPHRQTPSLNNDG